MEVVILGPSGQVGGMLIDEIHRHPLPFLSGVTTIGRNDADIIWSDASLASLLDHLERCKPDVIINTIAYTAVDKAESEPDQAMIINSDLPSALADWCESSGALLIHYSTDFVFDGMKQEAWQEWDIASPLSIYGKTKLAGEKVLQMSTASSITIRTSWVYGETGNNFMKTMIRLGREREELGVVSDQSGCPTYSRDLARATWRIVDIYQQDEQRFKRKQQLYHLSGKGNTTWHGFAAEIFVQAAKHESLALQSLNAISTSEYPTPAVRPSNSVLDCSAIERDYDIKAIDWRTSLAEVIERYYRAIG